MPLPRRAPALLVVLILVPTTAWAHHPEGVRVSPDQPAYSHAGLVSGGEELCFTVENAHDESIMLAEAHLVGDEPHQRKSRFHWSYEGRGEALGPGESFRDCMPPRLAAFLPPGTYFVAVSHAGEWSWSESPRFEVAAPAAVRCAYDLAYDVWGLAAPVHRCAGHLLP